MQNFLANQVNNLTRIYSTDNRPDFLLIALNIIIVMIAMLNARLHPPEVNYDGGDHIKNVSIYAEGRLPSMNESKEFFSPPLPYLLPAILTGMQSLTLYKSLKIAQFLNVVLLIGLIFFSLHIIELIRPSDRKSKLFLLAFMGTMTVIYRSFALIRGEPFVAFFCVLSIYLTIKIFRDRNLRTWNLVLLGFSIGLGILSRQWFFFILPAISIYALTSFKSFSDLKRVAMALSTALVIGALSGGWFYINLWLKYGTITAFNRESDSVFHVQNQPMSFYIGMGDGLIFKAPVTPQFSNQVFPVLYSDTWGDYWAHFSIFGYDKSNGTFSPGRYLINQLNENNAKIITNYGTFSSYLGKVNLMSITPTILIFLAFIAQLKQIFYFSKSMDGRFLLLLAVISSLAGYLWFLIQYSDDYYGSTIKSTYILHVFPILAILTSVWLSDTLRNKFVNYLFFFVFLVIFVVLFPAFITHYNAYFINP